MTRLRDEPEIIRAAHRLGVDPGHDSVQAIARHCTQLVETWVDEAGGADSAAQVDEIVCRRLGLTVEEVSSDAAVQAVARRYANAGDPALAALDMHLEGDTFGVLFRLQPTRSGEARYLAVVDCRGNNAARRFFTRWHEVSHLLIAPPATDAVLHRSIAGAARADPLEKLTDIVAAETAFFRPLLVPALEAEMRRHGALTFAAVAAVRDSVFPGASFHAALIACAKHADVPAVCLEAKPAYKKEEERQLLAGQQFLFGKPEPRLRAVVSSPNEAAKRSRIRISRNMRVPKHSLIGKLWDSTTGEDDSPADTAGRERLSIWTHSDGTALDDVEVEIEARRIKDSIVVLVRPVDSPSA